MAFEVLRTPRARRVVEQDMDRASRASYEAAREELRGRGCLAGGYRMAAGDGEDYPLCGRHLANHWRMYTSYPDAQTVVIVAVDRHTKSHDPAVELAETFRGLSTVGRRSRDKPPCCEVPAAPPALIDELRQWLEKFL
jgi:hypothetical protein